MSREFKEGDRVYVANPREIGGWTSEYALNITGMTGTVEENDHTTSMNGNIWLRFDDENAFRRPSQHSGEDGFCRGWIREQALAHIPLPASTPWERKGRIINSQPFPQEMSIDAKKFLTGRKLTL